MTNRNLAVFVAPCITVAVIGTLFAGDAIPIVGWKITLGISVAALGMILVIAEEHKSGSSNPHTAMQRLGIALIPAGALFALYAMLSI